MRIKISAKGHVEENSNCDLMIMPFGEVGEIDYSSELRGETKDLVKLGRTSKRESSGASATLVGAYTKNRAIKRLSAFLFENGRLSYIFDVNDGFGKYASSYGVGYFICDNVKCGILLGNDSYSTDLVKALSLCGCSLIIDLYPDFLTPRRETIACFYSHIFGFDYLSVGKDKSIAYTAGGNKKPFDAKIELSCKRFFREVYSKKPGI